MRWRRVFCWLGLHSFPLRTPLTAFSYLATCDRCGGTFYSNDSLETFFRVDEDEARRKLIEKRFKVKIPPAKR